MSDIQYYVLVSKGITTNDKQRKEIDKVEKEFMDTKLPFRKKIVDVYLISDDKNECKRYIKELNEEIREFFYIDQVGSEIQYTAFLDVLGFSNYIRTNISNDYQAEEFYDMFNEVIDYLQSEKVDKLTIDDADYLNDMKINHSWISDTFVVSIEYMNEIKKDDENIIRAMMLFRLSIIIASIHHFMASEFELTVRGAISSKYSCITNNFILGEGIVEVAKLEKEIAVYPRVIFEPSIINDEMDELMSRHYCDNDLNYIKKDCDGYYFVNYLAMLEYMPPMIGKTFRIPDDKINESAIKQKIKAIEKYQKIVKNGLKIENEKVKLKYTWLNNYLEQVLLRDEFQKNIIQL